MVATGTWLYASSPSLTLVFDAIPTAERAVQISAEMLPYSALISLLLYAVACMPSTLLPSRTEVACVCVTALISSWMLDEFALVAIVNGVAVFFGICALALAGRVARCAPERGARRADDARQGAQIKLVDAAPDPPLLQSEQPVPSATSPQKRHHPTPLLQPIGPDSSLSPQQRAMLPPAPPPLLRSLLEASAVAANDASLLANRASCTSSLGSPLS